MKCPICGNEMLEDCGPDGPFLRCWHCEMAEAAYYAKQAEESYRQFQESANVPRS